ALLHGCKLPSSFWADAAVTAAYLINRCASSATSTTPFERWTGSKPDVSHLRVFGCLAWVQVPRANRTS
ncbi:hypothetical protein CXG81DRAFT_2566, partial [Caulochytrium protostelioides]